MRIVSQHRQAGTRHAKESTAVALTLLLLGLLLLLMLI